jgi:acyl-CoA hydrolase
VFKRPAKEGNLVKIYAKVSKIGDTSATFEVEARSYNVFREDEKLILNTSMTFVRVDNEGVPISISETVKSRFAS